MNSAIRLLILFNMSNLGFIPPPGSDFMITEDSEDLMITEDNDFMITE